MLDLDRRDADHDLERVERTLVVLIALVCLVVAGYALGVSGLPGDAFGAALDWAISRGAVDASAPIVQAVATVL